MADKIEEIVKKSTFLVMMQTPEKFKSSTTNIGDDDVIKKMSKNPSYFETKEV